MIRLMLTNYSEHETAKLARLLESAKTTIEKSRGCRETRQPCHTCPNRHICSDLVSASVYAKDYKPAND